MKCEIKRASQITRVKKSSGNRPDDDSSDSIPFSSPPFDFDGRYSSPFLIGDRLVDCMSTACEIGDGHLLCCSETAEIWSSELNAVSTEVGDWVSFSASDRFGDGDLSDSLATDIALRESTALRG